MSRAVILAVVLVLISMSAAPLPPTDAEGRKVDEHLALLDEVMTKFQKLHHGRQYSREELVDAAIAGMLLKVDPEAAYFNEHDLSHFNQTVTIEYGKPGCSVRFERRLIVTGSIVGHSAFDNGVLPGDEITAINGDSVGRMSLSEAAEALAGAPGTTVQLTIRPQVETELRKVRLVRQIDANQL